MALGRSKPSSALKRVSKGFKELPRVLLVCEGEKTEPYYFSSLIKKLGLRATSVLIVGKECESAPISVYEYAAERFEKESGIDAVYCIFDRDRHQTFDAACDAISRHPSKKFYAIVSDPSFEFWLLLHFRFTRAPFVAQGSRSPGDVVLRALKDEWPEYEKNIKDIASRLGERIDTAIGHAIQARKDFSKTGERNPSTDVDLLVTRLKELAAQQLKSPDS